MTKNKENVIKYPYYNNKCFSNVNNSYCSDFLINQTGCSLVMQTDGNLVVYDKFGKAIWASNSVQSYRDDFRLRMQNDGNLVIYNILNKPIWATNTNGKGIPPYTLIFGQTCSFIIKDRFDEIIYSNCTCCQFN
jgi:hypothetical protein